MGIIAGIDEAGLGPVLGPLVVCAAVFEIPDENIDQCMWKQLAPTIVRKPKAKSTAIAIGDSKKLFKRKSTNGLQHLERAVLSMLHTGGHCPETLAELLKIITHDAHIKTADYPWYAPADLDIPVSLEQTSIALSANALSAEMKTKGIKLLELRSETVLAGEYNQLVRKIDNKSTTAIGFTCRLLSHLWTHLSSGSITVHVDRQGGRMRYLPVLENVFEDASFRILDESKTHSAYMITHGSKSAEVHFSVGAEDQHLPVALASMTCKYVREMFMDMLNAWWAKRVEDLAPTAGYYTDGRRFFGEIGPAFGEMGINEDMIYRSR